VATFAGLRNLRLKLKQNIDDPFFIKKSAGRKIKAETNKAKEIIIALRKKYFSVQDIKTVLDAQQIKVSEKQIHNILKQEGFARLPRRSKSAKKQVMTSIQLPATQSSLLENKSDDFYSQERTGILCLIPYIQFFGIDRIIEQSGFPGTKTIPALNAILSFVALKLSNIRRYSSDNIWCMDKCLGLFAGLNVLPKTAWFTSYSHRVTRDMNIDLLRKLNEIWIKNDLLSDTANLDFVAVPYWGDDSHLENNWSGKRALHRNLWVKSTQISTI
jgi:DNA-binding transcriptional MerR regulator